MSQSDGIVLKIYTEENCAHCKALKPDYICQGCGRQATATWPVKRNIGSTNKSGVRAFVGTRVE